MTSEKCLCQSSSNEGQFFVRDEKKGTNLNLSYSESTMTMTTVQPEEQNECEMEFQLDMVPDDNEIKRLETPKKPKKVSTFPSDFFQEIDLTLGLLGEEINETVGKSPRVKFHDNVFKLFIKPKTKRTVAENKKIIRLRDWFVTSECLLVNEIQIRKQRQKHFKGERKKKKDLALYAEKMKLSRMVWLQRGGSTHGEKRCFKDIYKKSSGKEITKAVDQGYLKKLTLERVIPQKNNPVVMDLTQDDDEPGLSNVTVHETLKRNSKTKISLKGIKPK